MPPELSGGIVFVGPMSVGRACRESRRELGTAPTRECWRECWRELGTVPNSRHSQSKIGPTVRVRLASKNPG